MKKYSTEIKWGIIFIIMGLLWMTMEKLLGWHDEHIDKHAFYTNIIMAPAIIIFYMALKDKRDHDYGGSMTWKQGFISGLIVSVVVTILTPLSQYIVQNIITPDYFANAIAYAVESGHSTQQDAEAYFNGTSYMWQAVVGALVMGAVTAALVALVVKKK